MAISVQPADSEVDPPDVEEEIELRDDDDASSEDS